MPAPFVDRIEDGVAVIIVDGEEKRVPLASLPPGVREGVYLTEDLKAIDEASTSTTVRQVINLRDLLKKKDDGGDFSL